MPFSLSSNIETILSSNESYSVKSNKLSKLLEYYSNTANTKVVYIVKLVKIHSWSDDGTLGVTIENPLGDEVLIYPRASNHSYKDWPIYELKGTSELGFGMRRNNNLCYIAFYNSPIKWYGANSWSDPTERVENSELKEKFNRCFSYNLKSKMFGYSKGCLFPLIGKIGFYNKLSEESYYNRKKLFTTVRVPDYVDYMVPALTGGNIVNIDFRTTLLESIGCTTLKYSKIKSLKLPDGIVSIESKSLHGCSELKDITIPKSVRFLPAESISAPELRTIIFEGAPEIIGDYAFIGCVNLRKIEFTKGVRFIGDAIFRYCRHLTDIVIPSGVYFQSGDLFGDTDINTGDRRLVTVHTSPSMKDNILFVEGACGADRVRVVYDQPD